MVDNTYYTQCFGLENVLKNANYASGFIVKLTSLKCSLLRTQLLNNTFLAAGCNGACAKSNNNKSTFFFLS